jgi:hypothetical protein
MNPYERIVMRKLTRSETATVGLIIMFVGSVIASRGNRNKIEREKKREAEAQLDRKIAFAYTLEQLEMVNEDLDHRIKIAKKAITDYDFNEIIEGF